MIELTPEQKRFFDENTTRKSVVMGDFQNAQTVWLDIGVQHFEIGAGYDDIEQADWTRSMLAKALETLTADALEQAQGREQQAFIAGIAAVMNNMDVDEERAWQQYLDQDKKDFREARGIFESAGESEL